ncbi:MAG: methylmalonyl-CoA epimerase [Proteobacteria bacterium]|jgi:methylmalonyl-CoA/ethylmalonyl-CoA epimerase|nr:methylmalonyl-CoA epimerase [Pseudomonadota bacterium]
MILSLDHIAIAVPALTEAIDRFAKDFGLELAGTEEVSSAKTKTAFFPISGTQIELISPMDGQGPVARSLERAGPGLHHLCFSTNNLTAEMERLQALGYRFTSTTPQRGAHNTMVAFIHPKSSGGVLIELVQHP